MEPWEHPDLRWTQRVATGRDTQFPFTVTATQVSFEVKEMTLHVPLNAASRPCSRSTFLSDGRIMVRA